MARQITLNKIPKNQANVVVNVKLSLLLRLRFWLALKMIEFGLWFIDLQLRVEEDGLTQRIKSRIEYWTSYIEIAKKNAELCQKYKDEKEYQSWNEAIRWYGDILGELKDLLDEEQGGD